MMAGSPSETEEGNAKWRWHGKAWWFRVDLQRTDQVEGEAWNFQGGEDGFGRDKEIGRWTVPTQVTGGMVGERKAKE